MGTIILNIIALGSVQEPGKVLSLAFLGIHGSILRSPLQIPGVSHLYIMYPVCRCIFRACAWCSEPWVTIERGYNPPLLLVPPDFERAYLRHFRTVFHNSNAVRLVALCSIRMNILGNICNLFVDHGWVVDFDFPDTLCTN